MQKFLLTVIFLCSTLFGFAQSLEREEDNKHIELKNYEILPDRGYSIETVRTDSTLVFVQSDSLRPGQAARYWLKIEAINRSSYAQPCLLTVLPNIDNTLYYFNEDANGWITQRAGIDVVTDKGRTQGRMHLVSQGQTSTTFYVLMNLGGPFIPESYKIPGLI